MAIILLIDDEADLTDFVRPALEAQKHTVECFDCAEDGLDRLASGRFDIVVIDHRMPGMSGTDFLEEVRARGIDVPVVLMTGVPSSSTAIQAMKYGAVEYIIKPGDYQSLVRLLLPKIDRVMETARQPKSAAPRPAPAIPDEAELVGNSALMSTMYGEIGLFADGGDTVLILGETGTGKELVARALHNYSSRKDRLFVALNCGALNENLLESELFGHVKAAFTGAVEKTGRFELAHQGTLFLDEIGDVPMAMQIKLLRVLQERKFERVGGTEPIEVDVRVLAATHRDIPRMISEGKFRQDLYFRLKRIIIRVPPLRDRLDDLPELVNVFVARAAAKANRPQPSITEETLERLRNHPLRWPGNVRELENVMHRACKFCRGPQLLPAHIDFQTDAADIVAPTAEGAALAALQQAIRWAWDTNQEKLWPLLRDHLERELLKLALERLQGNVTQIAERLDMAGNTVRKRIEEYGLR